MPNFDNLALGILSLLGGFGQGYTLAQNRQEDIGMEKDRQKALSRERELTREEERRARYGAEGERMIERGIKKEEFATESAQRQEQIDIAKAAERRAATEGTLENQRKNRELSIKEKELDASTKLERLLLQLEQEQTRNAKDRAAGKAGTDGANEFVTKALLELTKTPAEMAAYVNDPKRLMQYIQTARTLGQAAFPQPLSEVDAYLNSGLGNTSTDQFAGTFPFQSMGPYSGSGTDPIADALAIRGARTPGNGLQGIEPLIPGPPIEDIIRALGRSGPLVSQPEYIRNRQKNSATQTLR